MFGKFKYHIVITTFILSVILWVSLNLNQTYEIEKNIPVRIEVNKPYAVSGNIPLNIEVKFRGVGWSLIRLFTSFKPELNYNINAKRNEQLRIVTKDYITRNFTFTEDLEITQIYPETLFVDIDRYEEKYVKLKSRVKIECKEGYQVVGSPTLDPDSIKIGGSTELLSQLRYLHTREESFFGISSGIEMLIPLTDSLSNIIWRSFNEVKFTANIELSAEKEFFGIEITVHDIPPDKEVLLIPQSVSLRLKGGVNQLSVIDNSKITVMLNYSDIFADTSGSVSPDIRLPEGCTLSQLLPDKIQYVIKRKN